MWTAPVGWIPATRDEGKYSTALRFLRILAVTNRRCKRLDMCYESAAAAGHLTRGRGQSYNVTRTGTIGGRRRSSLTS